MKYYYFHLMRKRVLAVALTMACIMHAGMAQNHFVEMGEATGFGVPFSRGVSVADYNNDGFDDIFITRKNQPNILFKNLGDGRFADATAEAALFAIGDYNQTVWADFDNDGDVDFYLTTETESRNRLYVNNGDGTFTDITDQSGLGLIDFTVSAIWGDVNGDGFLDLFVFLLTKDDRFFLNNGDGTFTDYTSTAGIGQYRLSMGATFIDFDNDKDLDLYVAHDGHSGNFLYENDGQGKFTDISESSGIYTESEGMGVSVGDFNNDGWADIYLTNRLENFLFRNDGGTGFTEIGDSAGIDDLGMGWGVSWLDFDNDGFLDLYIGNDSDFSPEPNVLYRNQGDETFSIVDAGTSIASMNGTYATAIADLDQNGFPDLLTSNRGTGDLSEFFLNDQATDRHWLVLSLLGEGLNHTAIGARVQVQTEENLHTRYVLAGTSWSADDSKKLFFGLGSSDQIEKISVLWPDGKLTELVGFQTDKAYSISYSEVKTELSYEPLELDQSGNGVITSLEPSIEEEFGLKAYPSPFRDELLIEFNMETYKNVKVNILKYETNYIYNLHNGSLPIGEHALRYNLGHLASGLYLLQFQVGDRVFVKKVIKQ